MIYRNIFCYIFFTFLSIIKLNGQEVSLDVSIFQYQDQSRNTIYENSWISTTEMVSISYNDSIKGNWDYMLGVAYLGNLEYYYSYVDLRNGNETFTKRGKEGNMYTNIYMALSLGTRFWLNETRKGFFVRLNLVPHFLISSEVQESRKKYDTVETIITSIHDSKDDYESFNLLCRTGIGYKFFIYKKIALQVSINSYVKFGKVIKDVDERVTLSGGFSLGGSYTF